MTTPMITWAVVVAAIVLVATLRLLATVFNRHHTVRAVKIRHHHHPHIINIGTEAEEFFVPGDSPREMADEIIDNTPNPEYDI